MVKERKKKGALYFCKVIKFVPVQQLLTIHISNSKMNELHQADKKFSFADAHRLEWEKEKSFDYLKYTGVTVASIFFFFLFRRNFLGKGFGWLVWGVGEGGVSTSFGIYKSRSRIDRAGQSPPKLA